ncbi:ferric reductase like transmembrane component-domain-containing protein [Mycena crocata]|nr:ferric reductase like transmembrane component-domain-containing protein [Mycena crocata]
MVGAPKSPCPPPLKPAPSFLRPVVSVLRSRVVSGLSVTQMIVCVAYLNVLLYPSLYMSTGPFVDYNRFGYISVSQVPFVVALATKNNILGMLLGKGYEKLNFLHRFAGILAIATANIHGLGYVYNWCIQQTFIERISQPTNYLGLGALIAFDGLLLSSRGYLRRNAHTLFLFSHIFFFVALVVLGVLHNPGLVPYLSATSAIYLLDRFMRIAKTRITTASIRAIPEFGATRVELPYINHGWRPGQHVRLQILSSTMGIVGWTEVHPFTIASQSRGEEGLILICKTRGIWTDKLFTAATNGQWRGVGRNIKVAVEGPYGGSGFVMFHSYSAAMFVAGGSGITFALGAVQELIQHGIRGESRVRVMELIWVVQDAASLRSFVPQLAAMIKQSEHTDLRISVHYTKAIVGCPPMYRDTHPGLLLKAGRPRLLEILEATISHAGNGVQDRCGMIVAVCGPVGLADDVSDAVAQVDHGKVHDIGGIEMHEE